MSFNRGAVLAIMVSISFMALSGSCYGGVIYKVGDSAGWSNFGSFDYKTWSSAKTFQVGDTIVFEYDKQKHNVIELRHHEYHSCNTTHPEATYSTGNDSITIKFPGHYYYTCGFLGHCQAGLKVDIRVLPTSQSPGESPQTPSAPSPNPPNPFFESPPPPSHIVETPPSPTLPNPPNPFFEIPPPPSTSVETPPSPTLPSPPNPIFHFFYSPPPPSPTLPSPPSPIVKSPPSPSAPSPSLSGSPPGPPQPSPPQKRGASSTGSTLSPSLGSLGLFALGFLVAYYFGY